MQRASSALQYFKLVPCQVAVVHLRSKVSWQFCCIGMSNKVPGTLEYLEYLEYLGPRKTTPHAFSGAVTSKRKECVLMGNVRASTSNLNRVLVIFQLDVKRLPRRWLTSAKCVLYISLRPFVRLLQKPLPCVAVLQITHH